jgi:tetratricopeptide (TPR) repeat protein
MSDFKKLIGEIHKRSLWQVLGIYMVSAWIAYEVVQSLTEGLGLPAWFPPFAVVLFIIGLPIVLATAIVQEGTGRSTSEEPPAPEAGTAPTPAETADPTSTAKKLLTWRNAIAGGVLALALWGIIATGWLFFGDGSRAGSAAVELDPDVVAVLPFRVSGADPSLEYLSEGMLDLLAAKLTGEGGPRAVDPRAVMSAWNRATRSVKLDLTDAAAIDVAASLGSGHVLLGGIVGAGNNIVLNALLLSVPDGAAGAQVSVEGSTDSLTALVDNLTAQLLAREAGESQQRLAALTSTSLPALREYLDGQATYRRGRYSEAEQHFRTALELDSTFALAALGFISTRYWTANLFDPDGIAAAWRHRDRLSERDQALLLALAGPNYPEVSTQQDVVTSLERAVESAPDRPEGWYWLGEAYWHGGPAIGLTSWKRLAGDALGQAVMLDSAFSGPLSHLIDLPLLDGDRAETERMLALYLAVDSTSDFRDYERWQVALVFDDTARLDSVRERFSQWSGVELRAVVRTSMLRGYDLEDAGRAAALLTDASETPALRLATLTLMHDYELNRGRPARALAALEESASLATDPRLHLRLQVFDALYGDGNPDAAAQAATNLSPYAAAPLVEDASDRALQYADICTVEQWRLWQGEYSSTENSIEQLRSSAYPADSSVTASFAHTCASVLKALHASATGHADAERLVVQLDSVLRVMPFGVYTGERLDRTGNLVVTQLFELYGDLEAAYRAVKRREFFQPRYLSTYLREEGRLAARLGDREAAIRAYRHYLTLRSDPEPEFLADAEQIRNELARLTGESGL